MSIPEIITESPKWTDIVSALSSAIGVPLVLWTLYKLMKLYRRVYFHTTDIIEAKRIKKIFVVDDITILPNVPKVSNASPLVKDKDELKLIFISRIRDNKNLLLALESLAECEGDIVFDIFGPVEDDAYWKKCQLAMEALPKNIVIKYKGVVAPTDISTVMRQYHALLLPTKTENFGHVIVEAMQSGLIPIISDQTPWVNLEENSAGWSLDLTDINGFIKAMDTLYEMDSEKYTKLSGSTIKYITDKLNIEDLKLKYIDMLEKVIKGK